MEARLWKATWKRSGQKYSLSLVDYPKIKASGLILEEVIEKLEDLVADKLNDAVPHFEFIDPLPSEVTDSSKSYLHILTGHNCADGISNVEQLFAREKCKKCGNSGPRTEELIRLDAMPDGDLAFTDFLGQLISAQLADYLGIKNLREVSTRPVILCGKQTSDILELRSLVPRKYVAHKGIKPARWGFKCKACGFSTWMYMPNEAPFIEYVSKECLPDSSEKVFPIGVDDRMSLAVDKETRAAVIRSTKFKNVVSRKVGVLSIEEAVSIDSFFNSSGGNLG